MLDMLPRMSIGELYRSSRMISSTLACAILLSGCGNAEQTPSGQVVAVVDGKEITAAQLEQRIRKLPVAPGEVTPQMQAAVIRSLIDQTLIEAQAEGMGLDSQPDFVRALGDSRRELLVSAYVDRLSSKARPSEEDVQRYYEEHPAAFRERRTYLITDLPVTGSEGIDRYIALFRQPDASLEALAERLNADGIDAAITTSALRSDMLSARLSDELAKIGPGALITFRQGGVQHFARVDAVRANPVPLRLAEPRIIDELAKDAKLQRARVEVDRLRQEADIRLGEMAKEIMKREEPGQQVRNADAS